MIQGLNMDRHPPLLLDQLLDQEKQLNAHISISNLTSTPLVFI